MSANAKKSVLVIGGGAVGAGAALNLDIGGLEMNDYDVVSLHIPYGPGWDARRIDKLVYQTVSRS